VNSTREKGMALVTALLVLLLISAIIVGLSWMVMTNQRLSGNNANRQAAFYAAEAGMEKMTADIGAQYGATNALGTADITVVTSQPPSIPGASFNATPQSYSITYTHDPNNAGNPLAHEPHDSLGRLRRLAGLAHAVHAHGAC
jgi:Tfp pilus assembly protein PilX